MLDHLTIHARLSELVAQSVVADLLDFRLTDSTDGELAFAVVWQSTRQTLTGKISEYGTHRAVLARDDERTMLVWGHYFTTLSDALSDFHQR